MTATIELDLATSAERERARLAAASRARYAAGSEIGQIPPIANPHRRKMCERDLHLFLQWYFPQSAGLAPYGAQIGVINRIEDGLLNDGLILSLLPRSFSKSTLSLRALLWAILYGHRKYGLLYSATAPLAADAIKGLKTELMTNPRLLADFPEVCFPIRKTQGKSQRCVSQTYQGEATSIELTADTIVMPTIPGSAASGSIIQAFGITSATRGIHHVKVTGEVCRPDAALVDDPQDRKSAASPTTVAKRLQLLSADILQCGGHDKSITCILNATVIEENDMVDQLADPKLHPEWQSVRVGIMEKMPDAVDTLWLDGYAKIRHNYDPDIVGDQRRALAEATEFYKANREAMDKGAVPAWPSMPLKPGIISAVQACMELLVIHGADTFQSEFMNAPVREHSGAVKPINEKELRERLSGFAEETPPDETAKIVCFVDVHDNILYYTVAAVTSNFTGYVIKYGTFPEQPSPYFTMSSIKRTLKETMGVDTTEEAVTKGIAHLIDDLCGRDWLTPGGDILNMNCMLIDVGYRPDEVSAGVRLSHHGNIVFGSRGLGINPLRKQMPDYQVDGKKMIAAGPNPNRPRWFVARDGAINGLRVVTFDANWWKTVTSARLTQSAHSPGAWSLYGSPSRVDHGPYVAHQVAESPAMQTANGISVLAWLKVRSENHWWDTLVGCALAASVAGLKPPGKVTNPATANEGNEGSQQSSPRPASPNPHPTHAHSVRPVPSVQPRQPSQATRDPRPRITAPGGRPFWIGRR